jgi:sn-glycerol 3-phosphate transport system permease protein
VTADDAKGGRVAARGNDRWAIGAAAAATDRVSNVSAAFNAPTQAQTPPRRSLTALLYLAPSLLIFVVFVFYPLGRTVYLSFYANDLLGLPVTYVGLEQYMKVVDDPYFGRVMWTTSYFALLTVVPSIVIGLALALLVQPKLAGIGVFRTLLATPFAFSAAAAAVVFDVFYRPVIGLINGLLAYAGIAGLDWLTSPTYALPSVAVWRHAGYTMLICLAALQSIPESLYEAARIDGASRFAQFRWISLPLLTPTLLFLVVTSTIHSLQTFGEIKILTGGGPSDATTTLVYSLYKSAFAFGASDYGLASAQGVVLMGIVLVITVIQFRLLGRRVHYT